MKAIGYFWQVERACKERRDPDHRLVFSHQTPVTTLVTALRVMSGGRVATTSRWDAGLWVTGAWPAAQRSTLVLGSHAGDRPDRDSATPHSVAQENETKDLDHTSGSTQQRARLACSVIRTRTHNTRG